MVKLSLLFNVFNWTKFVQLIISSGRSGPWVVCSLPSGCNEGLADPEAPFYNPRLDPVTASRIRTFRPDWNLYSFLCLYPVTYSRLHRLIEIINPLVDLFPVFDYSDTEMEN